MDEQSVKMIMDALTEMGASGWESWTTYTVWAGWVKLLGLILTSGVALITGILTAVLVWDDSMG